MRNYKIVAACCALNRYATHIDFEHPSSSRGLGSDVAEARLREDGPNMLSPPKDVPEIIKFLKHFANPLIVLLIIAGLLCFLAYAVASDRDWHNLVLGAALLVVVFITCVMSYFQERAAGKVRSFGCGVGCVLLLELIGADDLANTQVMSALANMIPNKCVVIRDGKEMKINATELVNGDLVRMGIGVCCTSGNRGMECV